MPTEEEPGIEILAALLDQFPVIVNEDEEADPDMAPDLATPSASDVQPIDLETWIIETAEPHRINDEEQGPMATTQDESEDAREGNAAAMLQMVPLDNRTPATQIGSSFAESES